MREGGVLTGRAHPDRRKPLIDECGREAMVRAAEEVPARRRGAEGEGGGEWEAMRRDEVEGVGLGVGMEGVGLKLII